MERPAEEFRDDLIDRLKDLRYCAKYLSAASRDPAETSLAAMRNVVEAQKSMSTVASETGVDRVNLYRMLSETGNPRFDRLYSVVHAVGLRMIVEPMAAPARAPKPDRAPGDSDSRGRSARRKA